MQILDHVLVVVAVTQTPGVQEVIGRLPHRLHQDRKCVTKDDANSVIQSSVKFQTDLGTNFAVLLAVRCLIACYLSTGEFSYFLCQLPPSDPQLHSSGQDDRVSNQLGCKIHGIHPQHTLKMWNTAKCH